MHSDDSEMLSLSSPLAETGTAASSWRSQKAFCSGIKSYDSTETSLYALQVGAITGASMVPALVPVQLLHQQHRVGPVQLLPLLLLLQHLVLMVPLWLLPQLQLVVEVQQQLLLLLRRLKVVVLQLLLPQSQLLVVAQLLLLQLPQQMVVQLPLLQQLLLVMVRLLLLLQPLLLVVVVQLLLLPQRQVCAATIATTKSMTPFLLLTHHTRLQPTALSQA